MIGPANNWDMPLDLFKKCFTPKIINTLRVIEFCGNFGDPCIHPKFLDVVDYIEKNHNSQKHLELTISTNGSMQTDDFWATLGNYNNKHKDFKVKVSFCLDGADQEQHVKYRRLTNFDTIIKNAKTFIKAGGAAQWTMINFNHNEHQIEEAKKMSKEIGFETFKIQSGLGRLTGYLEKELSGDSGEYGAKTKKNKEEKIEVQTNPSYQTMKKNIEKKSGKKLSEMAYSDVDKVVQSLPVVCAWDKDHENGLLFEYNGTIWQCCFHGNIAKSKEWKKVVEKYGDKWNDIRYHSLEEIINHEFFTTYLEESFTNPKGPYPRLRTCSESCGIHISKEFANPKVYNKD